MEPFKPRFLKHHGITVIQKLDPGLKRLHPGKVGIVLAGGAISGGAFKAGGLKALDEVLVRRRLPGGTSYPFGLSEFDVFVGLSAGSMLAYALSTGIGADEIYRILRGESELFDKLGPWDFMRPNAGEVVERMWLFAEKAGELFGNWTSGATNSRTGQRFTLGATMKKIAKASGRLLPTGLFDPRAIARYLARNMERGGIRDNFQAARRQTGKELYLTATDLNRGELVVFGHDEPYGDVPISQAVAASCALPVWFRPMIIDNPQRGLPGEPDRLDLADGGLMRTANVRVAVEKGCELIICYNPFTRIRYNRAGRHLYEHGLPTVGWQAARTMIGARLDLAKELVYHDPNLRADVVFIEPAEDDYAGFEMNPLNVFGQDAALEHGYGAVRASIAAAHELLAGVFENHGIELSLPPALPDDAASQGPVELAHEVDLRESRGVAR